MITLTLIVAFGAIGAYGCENNTLPDGTKCPDTGLSLYVDPEHCSRYWECYDGCLTHMTCQLDYLFDPVHGWCDFPDKVCCGDRDCDGRDCNDNCDPDDGDFKCPQPEGFFADPENCIKYYQCNGNIATRRTCQKLNGQQLAYRPSDVQCDWPDRVDCGSRPFCDENDENCDDPDDHTTTTKKPNPCDKIDCTHGDGFYAEGACDKCFCECVGAAHYELCCPPGLFFNIANNQCDYPANINGC